MKRILMMLSMMTMAFLLSACGKNVNSMNLGSSGKESGGKLSVVTTIFPEYEWTRAVLGDKAGDVELTMLLDNGTDLHSFQPTADDIRKIASCDLFIYVGGESDAWVRDALKEAVNKDMKVINLLDALGEAAKEEEAAEGMEQEEEEEGEAEEGPEYDEHVWLSLKNAGMLVKEIAKNLCAVDEKNAEIYTANAEAYVKKLEELDGKYQNAVGAGSKKTLLFADRFPFRYLVDDYGLSYYAAFPGCSAETEASFKTVVFLAKKIDELGLHTVLTIEGAEHKIAETVVENSKEKNAEIVSMNSMQGITSEDMAKGTTYLSVMEENLQVLKQALQ